MNARCFVAAVVLLAACSAQARIGETAEQIQKRFGTAVKVQVPKFKYKTLCQQCDKAECYRNGDYFVRVASAANRSVQEIYWRADGQQMTDIELQAILNANGEDSKWTLGSSIGKKEWNRADQSAHAVYDAGQKFLLIEEIAGASKPSAKIPGGGLGKF